MRIVDDYDIKDLQVIAISANSPLGYTLDELGHSDMNDAYEWMVVRDKEMGYNYPYLYDGDTHEASLKYGPAYTPHVFLFDGERKLRYIGRLDGFEDPGNGDGKTIRAAIDTLLAGGEIERPIRKNFGCPVKWSWKNEMVVKDDAEWAEKPVRLKEIDFDDLNKLLENPGKKLKLINFWATWCGPCTKEFPSLVELQRIYSRYAFELITVSVDTPAKKDKALSFLESQNAAVTNYIYNGGDREDLINRVDPDWDGSIPLSILVEPGGKIVGYWNGAIDPYTVKKAIVDNKYMGRY
jgi:thiol-disulfide isomerase/thioredoxin